MGLDSIVFFILMLIQLKVNTHRSEPFVVCVERRGETIYLISLYYILILKQCLLRDFVNYFFLTGPLGGVTGLPELSPPY